MKRAGRRRLLWLAPLVLLAVLLALRTFVGDVFRVSTPSMRPTLLPGDTESEYVLVLYGAPNPLRRFDLVVFARPGDESPVVKRVVGLPGESIQLAGGDLWIDGRRLPADAFRPPLIPVFDSKRERLGERFHFKGPEAPGGGEGPWFSEPESDRGEVWRLEGAELERGDNRGKQHLVPLVTTSGLITGVPDPQWLQVNDLSIALAFELVSFERGAEGAPAEFVVELREAGDLFRARIGPAPEAGLDVELERVVPSGEDEVLATTRFADPGPGWHELRFTNRDDQLTLELDGIVALSARYDENEPFPGAVQPGITSVGPAVGFGGSRAILRIADVRIARDLYWASGPRFGEHGSTQRVQLGPDEIFVLGDNTLDSTDSRFFGPLRLSDVTGRPAAVVWPPASVRRLP